jgi:phenylacetate-CoA ligase
MDDRNAKVTTRLSLVAPCLNEEGNVGELCARFLRAASARGVSVEVVFVDDGSTDQTWQALLELQENYGSQVALIQHPTNCGIPQGWISGTEAAKGDLVCLIDTDLQNPPETVFDLLDAYENSSVELVRGVRCPTSRQSRTRIVFSRTLNALLNMTFSMNSGDNKSGFILASRNHMLQLVHHRGHYNHYQTFIGVAAHARNLRTLEVSTPFEDRRLGISFLSGRSLRVVREVIADIPQACREFGWRFGEEKN